MTCCSYKRPKSNAISCQKPNDAFGTFHVDVSHFTINDRLCFEAVPKCVFWYHRRPSLFLLAEVWWVLGMKDA